MLRNEPRLSMWVVSSVGRIVTTDKFSLFRWDLCFDTPLSIVSFVNGYELEVDEEGTSI